MSLQKESAIVLGGGFTGLLAAKVLSKYFKFVTVIERDSKPDAEKTTPRKGAPQGAFNHGCFPIGLRAIESIFPDFPEELRRYSADQCDWGEVRFIQDQIPKTQTKTGCYLPLIGRPLYDKILRDLIGKCKNISIQYDTDATGLIYREKDNNLSGVKIKNRLIHQESIIEGDFIVDSTGPQSRNVIWLEELGLSGVPVEEVELNYIQIAYRARWRVEDQPNWKVSVLRKNGIHKGGYIQKLENDREGKPQWLFALVTHFGDPLEKNQESYERLIPELVDAKTAEALKKATPLTAIEQYKVPKIRRKFFGKMNSLPSNFVALGDAQAVWPPYTGLGLSIGALAVLELQKTLEIEGIQNISQNYFFRSEKMIESFWNRYIVQGLIPMVDSAKCSLWVKFFGWYKKKLSEYSIHDSQLWRESILFLIHEKSALSLFHPSILLRVLLHAVGFSK